MMPFWLSSTSASGIFRAELLQRDPNFLTQQNCLVWMEGPRYEFSYPFGEYMPMNQVCASYVEPLSVVERCVCGTHIPSMLISRFELLKELEAMERKPKVIPFTMSTNTAMSVLEKRVDRKVVMNRVDYELKKFHGSFVKSNVTVIQLGMEVTKIRPVFLPLIKLMVTTRSNAAPVPAFICGATGKVVGPVLHVNPTTKTTLSAGVALSSLLSLAPLVDPGLATAAAVTGGLFATAVLSKIATMRFLRDQARQMAELKSVGMLNLASDSTGYRWTPDDEERREYEYREELRHRARQKVAFEERVKDEAARDRARAQGKHFDPKNRRRTDLVDADPLGYYELLGLKGKEFSATAKDVSKAFREAVRIHHPDVNKEEDNEVKKKHMQRIIVAYKILHDPKTKKKYDAGEISKDESADE
ncbi:chaperone protein DNAJ [Angomonas deanei]|uniref:DnaJ domain containing protein, putative n=1 Tax=Angomonas deanei TaxID=59799 RepID=A0A7G2CP76_9TRYP|nr:chaperone protein DNAJ [Angomonas deanei]CAD2220353.1 DnaJ domain containing protein, putative [Angomonas deanei]|eukprot:EPY42216.1 chaperone protein DNAJ [Angomonas deanei]